MQSVEITVEINEKALSPHAARKGLLTSYLIVIHRLLQKTLGSQREIGTLPSTNPSEFLKGIFMAQTNSFKHFLCTVKFL